MPDDRTIALITGAGSGLGLASALRLAARGYHVYGAVLSEAEGETLRREAANRKVRVCPVRMDVTRQQHIDQVVSGLIQQEGRIDALVHFAGMGLRGFFEDLTMEEIRDVYDVNVFGIMALTKAVLPHMRQRRSGRIVITSSAAGRMGSMSISGYSSTKFAVEGFGECLMQEVRPFNIYVSLLEPGLIQTPHFGVNRNRARNATNPNSPYYQWFCQHEALVDNFLANNKFTPEDVAKTVEQILSARIPRLRYMVGFKARMLVSLRGLFPGELFERIYFGIVRRKVTTPRDQSTTLSGTP